MMEVRNDNLDWTTLRVSGKLERRDYEQVVPELERHLDNGERRWLVEMDDFKGFTPGALVEELKFDLRHRKDFDRLAVIESSEVAGLGPKLVKPFFSGDVKVFKKDERKAAEAWMRQGN